MRLKTLEFWSDEKAGWQSGKLQFGKQFTFVSGSGENTCGKTPMLKGIFFALGCKQEFRNDITEKVTGVRLEVELGGHPFLLERKFSTNTKITVKDLRASSESTLEVEWEISRFLMDKLGFPAVKLTTNKAAETDLYFSTIAPLFFKEQLGSWHTIYPVAGRFIADQREESMRFLLGLPPRNPFGIKAEIKKEKKNITRLTEEISDRNEIVNELREIFGVLEDVNVAHLEDERTRIKARLVSLEKDFSALTNISKEYDSVIQSKQMSIGSLMSGSAERTARIRSLRHIITEVTAEADTLSLNEDAADRFRNSESICANPGCGLFLASKEAYGKSLLYLKDQMKDLETNVLQLQKENEKAEAEIEGLESEVDELQAQRTATMSKSGADKISDAIRLITNQLVDVEMKIATASKFEKQKTRLENLLMKREKTHGRIDDLEDSKNSKREDAVGRAKSELATAVNKWKECLHLTSLKGEAVFGSGFTYMFGPEKYTQLDGSARVRAVLAFHAAMLELALEKRGNHPGIFVLDTPQQQELKTNDLKDYFKQLRSLVGKYPDAQIIFSSSDFAFKATADDKVWKPNYPGENHPMYLGVAGAEISRATTIAKK